MASSKPMIEAAFEDVCEHALLAHGYRKLTAQLDRERAIYADVALEFIRSSQPKEWQRLEQAHGADTSTYILNDLTKWLDTYGCLHVLRHGFKCYGRNLRLAYFQAAHGLTPEVVQQYQHNQLAVSRQVHYSLSQPHKSIDLLISLNGIPLITIELKNPLTGQSAEHACQQYQRDRDPREPLLSFKQRSLVHFAVDPDQVLMTTRLAGTATRFLPFNRGDHDGAGNPPDPQGRSYRTAYLWEEVLAPDSLLEIVARFIHLQSEEKRDDNGRKFVVESMIFPRYHQLQAVRLLVTAAQQEGVGHNYLIEHSAGSGKSNTIAWLTHRLASLYDHHNQRIFDSVIVVTDRRVLDRQLQDTIFQFEHRQGVVQNIDQDSSQLAQALEQGIPIIVTTLQKFPFVSSQLQKIQEQRGQQTSNLPTRNYAVVIDEAHSSQSGESATQLREVLGGEELQRQAAERAEIEGDNAASHLKDLARKAKQLHVSFFAFTATPKHHTYRNFGRNNEPFHRYTMKQAIEEGFIMDVLQNYITYETFFKITKKSADDPQVIRKQASKALSRFQRLMEHNISQKTQVIVEHFYQFSRHKIGGRAKAMVVTASRLHAVRYKQQFDRYIKQKGYEIRSLVAFSGVVHDDKISGKSYTEETMNNGIRESELPDQFAGNEYHVLLVAEKYQTGFDQPLLHSMYIDRRLAGIQAVQTLSRLNRTHPHKQETFVLDFVNKREEIFQAFKDYYTGASVGELATPDQLYQLKYELDLAGLYLEQEVQRFCDIYFKPTQRQSANDHQAINAVLDVAVGRYKALAALNPEQAELTRNKLQAFQKLYQNLSQIIPYYDSELEHSAVFIRYLLKKLPRLQAQSQYNFDDELSLDYYRLQKISEGSINLNAGYAQPLKGPTNLGSAVLHEDKIALSQLVDLINQRFGTDFNQADQLFFDQIIEAAANSSQLQQAAQVNSIDKFGLLFRQAVEDLFMERMEQNEVIFARYMNDPQFQQAVSEWLNQEVYGRIKHNQPSNLTYPAPTKAKS